MRKNLVLTLVLLCGAVWLQAQSSSSSSDAPQTGKSSDLTTIQGCLQTDNGIYTLTDNDGNSQQLSGGASKLKHYVGHQVEITGKPGIRTVDTSQSGIAASVKEIKVFDVKGVKNVANTCK